VDRGLDLISVARRPAAICICRSRRPTTHRAIHRLVHSLPSRRRFMFHVNRKIRLGAVPLKLGAGGDWCAGSGGGALAPRAAANRVSHGSDARRRSGRPGIVAAPRPAQCPLVHPVASIGNWTPAVHPAKPLTRFSGGVSSRQPESAWAGHLTTLTPGQPAHCA